MSDINIYNESDLNKLDAYDIYSYWSMGGSPRDSQIKTLDWIKNLSPDIKYILCELPVGAGKSPIGVSTSGWFSKAFGNSYILTPQKILQKHYEDWFSSKLLHSL